MGKAAGRLFCRASPPNGVFPRPRAGRIPAARTAGTFCAPMMKGVRVAICRIFAPCRRRGFCPTPGKESVHGVTRLLRDFLPRPSEGGAFVTQRAAALRDAAQPLMRSFAAHRKPGWNLLQRRAAAEETFRGAAFPAPLFSSEDERPRLQGKKQHRSAAPLHALRRCLTACRGAEPAHQKPVLHRARGSRPQRRFRRNNGVRPALRSMPDPCPARLSR